MLCPATSCNAFWMCWAMQAPCFAQLTQVGTLQGIRACLHTKTLQLQAPTAQVPLRRQCHEIQVLQAFLTSTSYWIPDHRRGSLLVAEPQRNHCRLCPVSPSIGI